MSNQVKWQDKEKGPECFCGMPTRVFLTNDKPALLCLFHTNEEGAMFPLPAERPENWPNLSTEEMVSLVNRGIEEDEKNEE